MPAPSAGGAALVDFARPERLRRWIIGVGLLVIVANAASSAFDQWRSYRLTMSNTERELGNAARILAAQTAGNLRAVDVVLRDVADSYRHAKPAGSNGEVGAALAARTEGLHQLLTLTIVDADGAQRYRSVPFESADPPNIGDRAYFTAQRDNPGQGLFVSEPFRTQVKQRPVIALSRRLNDAGGRFGGVVTAMLDLDDFQRFYHEIKLGPRAAIILARNDGTLIVREPVQPDMVGRKFVQLPAWFSEGGTTLLVSPMDGVKR